MYISKNHERIAIMSSNPNVDFALRYLAAVEAGATGADLAAFFDPEVEQIEYPNRLVPAGVKRDLAELAASAEKGQRVISDQRFAVRHVVANGDEVAVELDWSGTLKVPLGDTPPGGRMHAAFAVFLRFRDGRIVSQHNYDCFHAF
ncbi:Hypothetical protein A7982_11726 [Minicystis rosea]|nr:Hypothetical protein A7982_11726 [Minicystis rosea]